MVVSHALWQRRFGGDPSLVGKPITLDGTNYTVIGIAPPAFSIRQNRTVVAAAATRAGVVPARTSRKRAAWAISPSHC